MNPERLFLDHLDVIEQAVRFVARRHLLSPEEAEELASSVKVKIIDNDYEVLRKFEGRSSLRTYLTAVVQRHFLDARIAQWGKWRPCVRARQLGPVGVLLDRYISRDGLSMEMALERVQAHPIVSEPRDVLIRMAESLPVRAPRRFVSDTALEDVPDPAPSPHTIGSVNQERATLADQALAEAFDRLDSEDRLVLRLKFQQGLQVSQIAKLTGLEQKPLYRRIELLLKRLRQELEAKGLTANEIADMVGRSDVAFTALGGDRLENTEGVRP